MYMCVFPVLCSAIYSAMVVAVISNLESGEIISELTQSGAVLLEVRLSVRDINKVPSATNMDGSTISRSLCHACSWEPFRKNGSNQNNISRHTPYNNK